MSEQTTMLERLGRVVEIPAGAVTDFKKLMMAQARRLGYAVADDNEADAIGMLIHMLHGAPANARAQMDLLDRVADL